MKSRWIYRRKSGHHTIHELDWGHVTHDTAASVSIECLRNILHTCRVFFINSIRYILFHGPNHSLCASFRQRRVLGDSLPLDSVRLHELINRGGAETEIVFRHSSLRRSEEVHNLLLYEVHNYISSSSIYPAYHWPESEVLHLVEKVALIAGSKSEGPVKLMEKV